MAGPEPRRGPFDRGPGGPPPGAGSHRGAEPPRYGRYVVLLAIVILVFITVNTLVTKPNGAGGVASGEQVPPFAVPLAASSLKGDANVSRAGRAPACTVRKPGVLNICQLYEHAPVALVLFVQAGSCPAVLSDLEALMPSFPRIRFAAVALKSDRGSVRRLIASHGLTLPVGIDDQGDLAALYKLASCPQVTFVLPGGRAQGKALLGRPSRATLRARLGELQRAAATGTPR
jgi:hypothetical protein